MLKDGYPKVELFWRTPEKCS